MSAILIEFPGLCQDPRALEFGARLRFLRKQAGMSPAQAAERLGVEVGVFVRLEHGGSGLTLAEVLEICERFGETGGGAA